MADALTELLAPGLAIAVSPLPVLAALVLLLSDRGLANACAFLGGWAMALAAVAGGAAVLRVATTTADAELPAATLLQFAIAVPLFALAVHEWRHRHDPELARKRGRVIDWIRSISPARSVIAGILCIVLNPKDLLLALAAGSSPALAALEPGAATLALAVFIVVASATIALPAAAVVVAGPRVVPLLHRARSSVERRAATVTAVALGAAAAIIAASALPL